MRSPDELPSFHFAVANLASENSLTPPPWKKSLASLPGLGHIVWSRSFLPSAWTTASPSGLGGSLFPMFLSKCNSRRPSPLMVLNRPELWTLDQKKLSFELRGFV